MCIVCLHCIYLYRYSKRHFNGFKRFYANRTSQFWRALTPFEIRQSSKYNVISRSTNEISIYKLNTGWLQIINGGKQGVMKMNTFLKGLCCITYCYVKTSFLFTNFCFLMLRKIRQWSVYIEMVTHVTLITI